MVTPAHLQALLTELEAAVRAGDRARATELERAILQRLAAEAADQAALERRGKSGVTGNPVSASMPRCGTQDDENGAGLSYREYVLRIGSRPFETLVP